MNINAEKTEGCPKNGIVRFKILDMHEYEKIHATIKLLTKLGKGEKSGREKGWLSADDVETRFGITHD
jgi:hypothetical protein